MEVDLAGLVVHDKVGHRAGSERQKELVQAERQGDVVGQPIRPAADFPKEVLTVNALDFEREFRIGKANRIVRRLRVE